MTVLATMIWIATSLCLLGRCILTKFIVTAGHALSTSLLFPAYVFTELKVAASDWHRFFFKDVPWYLSAIYSAMVWLKTAAQDIYDDIDIFDKFDDAERYFTRTIPARFEDTFGSPLGDLKQENWSDLRRSLFVLCIVAATVYILSHCERQIVVPPSPTIAADDNEPKADVREVEMDSSPITIPYKPLKLVNFGTPGFFTNPRPTFHEGRFTLPPPSAHPQTPHIPTPIVEPEETPRPVVAAIKPASPVAASTPPQDKMEIVMSPPEALPALSPAAPLPPSFAMICQGVASRKDELAQALREFCLAAHGFGDLITQMSILGLLLEDVYHVLVQHRDFLTM
jgi:hypothetical protein